MRLVPALVIAMVLVSPALAQTASGASEKEIGPVQVTYFLTESGGYEPRTSLRPSEAIDLYATFSTEEHGLLTAMVTVDDVSRNVTWSTNTTMQPQLRLPVIAPDTDTANFTVTADVVIERHNGTNVTRLASGTISVTLPVVTPTPSEGDAPTPPPVTPAFPVWAWYLVAAAVLVIAFVAVQRARKRQVRAAPRSRTLQELQVEDKAERTSPKRAAEVEAARAEVEAREAERLAQRENSILDAKRNDILRSIELLRQRHERGELTAFQFQKLKEKKDAQLAELDRQDGV